LTEKPTKELFINSVRQIRIHDNYIIPTAVLYKDGKTYVGANAIENSDDHADLKENFKVELGNDDPIKLAQHKIGSDNGSRRSTLGIAKDFIDYTLTEALSAIERRGAARPKKFSSLSH